jgi:hypothetical protein
LGFGAQRLGLALVGGRATDGRGVGVVGHLGVGDELGVAGHQHGGQLHAARDQRGITVQQGVRHGQAAGAVPGRDLAGQDRTGGGALGAGGLDLPLIEREHVLGLVQGGLGSLQVRRGHLELRPQGPRLVLRLGERAGSRRRRHEQGDGAQGQHHTRQESTHRQDVLPSGGTDGRAEGSRSLADQARSDKSS